jgi:antitoxin component of RelBE/YafQ-DinJ toxin-antitoxin module
MYNLYMKTTTSLLQVRIPEDQKLIAQSKLSKVGLTIPDFLRMSIMQFNQTGEISIKLDSEVRMQDQIQKTNKIFQRIKDQIPNTSLTRIQKQSQKEFNKTIKDMYDL